MKTISVRPYSDEKLNALKDELSHTNWDQIIGTEINDIEQSYCLFSNHINKLYLKHFPLKRKKISVKRLRRPWITSEVKRYIKIKSEHFKLFKQGYITRAVNNQMRNKVNKIVKQSRDQYYLCEFNKFKSNNSKKWRLIHELSGTYKIKHDISELFINNITYANHLDIANKFNEYFNRIATDLDNCLPTSALNPLDYVARNTNRRSFFICPISTSECAVLISTLKITKCDIDVMPTKIFSSLYECLSEPLSKIMNASFSLGVFPQSMKLARVTPVHKRGDKRNPTNYRPICCLPYISKIFERYFTNELNFFFAKHNIISKSQFGFQKTISTLNALINLTEDIYNSLNNKKHHLSILIDLKKAFDTMNHNILLRKLELYGVRGLPLLWIGSYLRDRPSFVGIAGTNSSCKYLNIGIPQGSIIGPLLFIVFINDLPNVSDYFRSCLFADDTTLSISNSNSSELIQNCNSELIKIHNWTLANRLTINIDKTEVILFSNKSFDKEANVLTLNGGDLQYSDCCKFLGIKIDDSLTFSKHIDCISGKLSRGAGILHKIKDTLPIDARICYYYGFLYPYISYCAPIWASTYDIHLKPLITQQKRAIRIIADEAPNSHTPPLFKKLGLLTVVDIFKFQLLAHMHKINYRFRNAHNVNTRYCCNLRSKFHRLTKTQHAVSYLGPNEWNMLPRDLQDITNCRTFRKKLKAHLLEKYDFDPG